MARSDYGETRMSIANDNENRCDACGKLFIAGEGVYGKHPLTTEWMDLCMPCADKAGLTTSSERCEWLHRWEELDSDYRCPHDLARCRACGGRGWCPVAPDGHEAPPTMAYLQKCDVCNKFTDDFQAAIAYRERGNGDIIAILVRHDG